MHVNRVETALVYLGRFQHLRRRVSFYEINRNRTPHRRNGPDRTARRAAPHHGHRGAGDYGNLYRRPLHRLEEVHARLHFLRQRSERFPLQGQERLRPLPAAAAGIPGGIRRAGGPALTRRDRLFPGGPGAFPKFFVILRKKGLQFLFKCAKLQII